MAKEEKNTQEKIVQNRAQYIKDLSFENPKAPNSISNPESRPQIDISVDVKAMKIGKADFEVILTVNTTAKTADETLFIIELTYGGLFNIQGFAEEELQPILLIHCPTLLFPYARRVISDCTRDGGLPPLMVDPIDFAALYKQRVEEAAKAQAEQAANDK